eukprot:Gb_27228 [translate_table: standard]
MEKNGTDPNDLGSGWLEVKKKHKSNSKLSMSRSTGVIRGLPESLRKARPELMRDHAFVSGQVGQSSNNEPLSPRIPVKAENGERNVIDTKLVLENKHLDMEVQEWDSTCLEGKIMEQTVGKHSLQFGGIEPSLKPTTNSFKKVELMDTVALRKHVSEGFMRDSCNVIDYDLEGQYPSVPPLAQVPKIKWGNLDEDELEQTRQKGIDSELAKPQNCNCSSVAEDKMPLVEDATFVIDRENTSSMEGNSRAGEEKEDIGVIGMPSGKSEILNAGSESGNFTENSLDIVEDLEICDHQLPRKSGSTENLCKVQVDGSIQNEPVEGNEHGNRSFLTVAEAEKISIQDPSPSCVDTPCDSLDKTLSDKVSIAGDEIQQSVSSIDKMNGCEGSEHSSECTNSCRAELVGVTSDTAQNKDSVEISSENVQINRERFNEDISMATNMLMNAFGKGETGESKERFRQRLWCFLFENLNRAIDELYLLCELECDVEQMKEATVVLEEAHSDFKELKSRVEGFDKVKKLSSASQTSSNEPPLNAQVEHRRPHALSWEVRRMASSPRRAEILSSSLEAFKKIQQESASKNAARQGKRRDAAYPTLAHSCKEIPSGKSPGRRDSVSNTKEVGAKLKGKQVYNSDSANRGTVEKRHIDLIKSNKECSLPSDARTMQKSSHFASPQLTGKKEGCIPSSNFLSSSSKVERPRLASEMESGNTRRVKIHSSENRADKNNKAPDSFRRQFSTMEKEKEKKPIIMNTSLDAWKEKRNWEDILASPLRSSSRTSHSPVVGRKSTERVRVLHDKLMSPERRRKSPLDMKKDVDEKHARATRIRRELENERAQRLQRASEKLNRVSEWQAVRSSKLREGMYARQQRGESRHEAYLAQIARRASDESSKVSEVRFITSLNEENKKLSLRQKLQDSELRRAERLQIIKIKQKEDIAREEAVLERRKLLEAEKLQRLAETQRKKEEAQARREEERKAASAAREAKAVEQVRKKEVRAKAQQEEAELQAQKLAERLSESELRRKVYLEQIREKAAMDFREQASPSSRRPSSRDGQPRSMVNQAVEGYLANVITGLTGFGPRSCSSLSQQQSVKKRVKKTRQRLMAQKYEFIEPPVGVESAGLGSMSVAAAARSKIGRWLQDLQRLQQARKAGATSIGLIIGEMIKYLDGKEAELHAARQAGLLDFVASALPASHTSKPEACQTTISLLRIVKVVLALAANRSYFLARNLLPPVIPMLSAALENYCTMAASSNGCSGGAGNSSISVEKTSDEKLDTIGEVLEGLLWSVAAIMGHACTDERQLQMQDDLTELIVACQVIHHLRDLFSLFDRPQMEGAPFPAPVLLGLNLLRILTCPRGNVLSIDWEAHSALMETVSGPLACESADCKNNVVSLQGSSSNKNSEKETEFHLPVPVLKEDGQISNLGSIKKEVKIEAAVVGGHDQSNIAIGKDVEDVKQVESADLNKTKVGVEGNISRDCTKSCILQKKDDEKSAKEVVTETNPLLPSGDGQKVLARNKSEKVKGAIGNRSMAFLVSVIAETGLVGLPSLLTAVLLQANPRSTSDQAAYMLPYNFEEVATAVLKILNNLARLDIKLVQSMLARPDLQMEFFHLMSFLLSHCTWKWKNATDQVALLLFETLLLLGYFALLHTGNQAVLRWGKSPTILHKICDLPFAFFSDPQLTPVLVGTLLAVCYGCEQNRDVVQQELSMEMLLVLMKSSKQRFDGSPDSRQMLVPRVGVQLDVQSNSISYHSGTMDVIAEESEEDMQKIQERDDDLISQEVFRKLSGDSPAIDTPGNSHQQHIGRPSKSNLMSSDHTNSLKRSNKTVTKTVSQGEFSSKESLGTRTNNTGKSVKGKAVSASKEIFTSQAKGSKVLNPEGVQKGPYPGSTPVSSKRGLSAVLPDHMHNSSTGIRIHDSMSAGQYQGNPLLSPAFMLPNRFPINLLDHAQEFFAAALE